MNVNTLSIAPQLKISATTNNTTQSTKNVKALRTDLSKENAATRPVG